MLGSVAWRICTIIAFNATVISCLRPGTKYGALLRSARLVMERPSSLKDSTAIAFLTSAELQPAAGDADDGAISENPALQALWRKLRTIGAPQPQTDVERVQ